MVICLQDTARVRICSKKTKTQTSLVKSQIHVREDVADTDKSSMSGTHVGVGGQAQENTVMYGSFERTGPRPKRSSCEP